MVKFIFGRQINIAVFYNVITFWVPVARHARSTQNKYAFMRNISLRNVGDEVDLLPADKQKTFLLVDSIFLGVCS